jgi:two-component system nitrate/nitrite response regulator NarL
VDALAITDNRLFGEALARALRAAGLDASATTRPDDREAAASISAGVAVALIDARMPGSVLVVRRLRAAAPATKTIMLGVDGNEREVIGYIEAGALGYLPRGAGIDDLLTAIDRAARGESTCSPRVTAALMERVTALAERRSSVAESALTPREFEIVSLLQEGLSNKEIADRLYIELQTAKNHVHNILKKLNVQHRSEVARSLGT